MRVLITGGAGFIGRHLTAALARRGDRVRILDVVAPWEVAADEPAVEYRRGSILDPDEVAASIEHVDLVIHLAGIAEPLRYGSDPLGTLDVNLTGSLHVVRRCADRGVPILFASTSEVYGVNPDLPWSEDARRVLGPVSNVRWCYATAKAAVEHYLAACRTQLGLRYTTVRLFNAYGPGLSGRVVDTFVRRALAGAPLVVHGSGGQTRCFCYIDDVVRAFVLITDGPELAGQTYNVGTTEPTRILDLAQTLIRLTGSASTVEYASHGSLYEGFEDIPQRQPDTSRIARELGWQPIVGLEDGLTRMVDSFRRLPPAACRREGDAHVR